MPSTSTGIKSVRVGGPELNQTVRQNYNGRTSVDQFQSYCVPSCACLCVSKRKKEKKRKGKKLAAHFFVAYSCRRSLHAEVLSLGSRSTVLWVHILLRMWHSSGTLCLQCSVILLSQMIEGFFGCENSSNKLWVGYAQVPWIKLRGQKDNIKFSQFSHLTEYCTYTCYYSVDVHF